MVVYYLLFHVNSNSNESMIVSCAKLCNRGSFGVVRADSKYFRFRAAESMMSADPTNFYSNFFPPEFLSVFLTISDLSYFRVYPNVP